ncbi:hypothetical protein BK816_08175 [Boudabousia tangfeifanii]|uniref:Acyltransferase 3 domain-containing protein n=1 Tax=Boudabousia tangfeifanii TaxID=1912795 RepID=A0A1D9MM71_9ACTO|nr:acyltransferase [Boudabousia tangfeifanii]AOZ73263.1 hypothetical protein BK816_08175 [Boudabousia tangfeifanii]
MRLDSLTGLRWWAAFGVFLYHIYSTRAVKLPYGTFYTVGNFGVAFFFVLSGFVLTWSSKPQVGAKQFYLRRFARIYPSHFVALLIALPIFYRFNPDPHMWWQKTPDSLMLVTSLLLIQGFWQLPSVLFGGNPAAWTLSCEAVFYALFPALKTGKQKVVSETEKPAKQTPAMPATVFFGAIASVMALQIVFLFVLPLFWQPPIAISRLPEFLYGVVAAQYVKQMQHKPKVSMWWGYLLLLIAITVYLQTKNTDGTNMFVQLVSQTSLVWFSIVFMIVIMLGAMVDISGKRNLMRHPSLVKLGEWSYCFYLVHATVIYAWIEFYGRTRDTATSMLVLVEIFALALLLTTALHYVIEKPFERRLRAWGDQRFGQHNPRPREAN